MKLIVVMNVFNEAPTIGAAIDSVIEHVDEIHVFDGAYKHFPHEYPYSTDGTKEICESYGSKVVFHETKEAWTDQIEKRTAMFVGKPGDYYFKLDGDEWVSNPELLREYLERDVGYIWVNSNLYPHQYVVARIFKHRNGMHYAGRHHWLYDGDNNFITSDQKSNPELTNITTPISIFNLRRKERESTKSEFVAKRNMSELTYPDENSVYSKNINIVVTI